MTSRIKENLIINGWEFGRIEQEITFEDVAAIEPAGIKIEVPIEGFPTKAIPVVARARKKALFDGDGILTGTVEIGDTGNTDELLKATDIMGGVITPIGEFESPPAPQTIGATEEAAYAPVAKFTFTVDDDEDNTDLTAGSVVVIIHYWKFHANA